jgi:parallel beta-helix repeat protein
MKGVMSLLVCVSMLLCIVPLTQGIQSHLVQTTRTVWYVDDDNTGPWDGSEEFPFPTIQEALLYAQDGDTVYVFAGTYYSSGGSFWPVSIRHSIMLQGEDPATTEIVGGGTYNSMYVVAFYETTGPAEIRDFTIRKSGTDVDDGGILVNADNVNIINNTLTENQLGIYIIASHTNCRIEQNIITQNQDGIFGTVDESEIAYNQVVNNSFNGIVLYGNNNSVHNNLIRGHSMDGVDIKGSKSCKVVRNNFYDNDKDAYFINSPNTKWRGNYWGEPRILPKAIIGEWRKDWYHVRIMVRFDWPPALKPNRITPI